VSLSDGGTLYKYSAFDRKRVGPPDLEACGTFVDGADGKAGAGAGDGARAGTGAGAGAAGGGRGCWRGDGAMASVSFCGEGMAGLPIAELSFIPANLTAWQSEQRS